MAVLVLALAALTGTALLGGSEAAPAALPHLQDEVTLDLVGQLGGAHNAVAVEGDYAFLGSGTSLSVLDISDRSQPHQVASLNLPEPLVDIFVSGNYAYIAGGGLAFSIVDISQPLTPTFVISHTLSAWGVHVAGNHAYVAAVGEGLRVFNVSNPISPTEVFSLTMDAQDVFVLGNRAYVLEQVWPAGKLWVLDVTDPAHPTTLGSTETRGASRVFVLGNYAYVANGWNKGIQIVDVSNPAAPTVVGSYGDGDKDAYDVVARDGSTYVYIAGMSDGLMVLDASDPTNPTEVRVLTDISPYRIALDNAFLYVTNTSDVGFLALDLSDPADPQATGQFEAPEAIYSLVASGDHLYVSSWERLWVYSLAAPEQPALLGSYVQWGTSTLFAQDNYLYALALNDLYIIDISDPSNLVQTGIYSTTVRPMALFVLGDYAYLLFNSTMEIVDVSNPSAPVKRGELAVNGGAALYVRQGSVIAYLVDNDGLHTVDVSDPTNPQAMDSIAIWGDPAAVWVWDDIALVGSSRGGYPDKQFVIEAFDVTDPNEISRAAQTGSEAGGVWDLKVYDGTILAAIAPYSGLYTYEYEAGTGFRVGPRLTFPGGLSGLSVYVPSAPLTGAGVQQTGTTAYIYGNAESKGMKIIRRRTGPPVCCLRTVVSPPEAADEGCTAAPAYTEGACGSQVEVTASENASAGWNFVEWTGAASGEDAQTQALMNGRAPNCSVATAEFVKPILTLGGGQGVQHVCPAEVDLEGNLIASENVLILPIKLCANVFDNWWLRALTFEAYGSGDEVEDVKLAKLYLGRVMVGSQLGLESYAADDGHVTFHIDLMIPAGDCRNLLLAYDFADRVLESPSPPRDFNARINVTGVLAEPMNYDNYVKHPEPDTWFSGGKRLARVYNVFRREGYDTIQQGVDGAVSGETLEVCPGEYRENVTVNKGLTIRSVAGSYHTTVIPADENRPIFHLKASNTVIESFMISGRRGIHIEGEDVVNCAINENVFDDTELYGIRLSSTGHHDIRRNTQLGAGRFIYLQDSVYNEISYNMTKQEEPGSSGSSGRARPSSGEYRASNRVQISSEPCSDYRGYIILRNSNDNVITGNDIAHAHSGICLAWSHRNLISANEIHNYASTRLIESEANRVVNNTLGPLSLISSSRNHIENNNIGQLYLERSHNNEITSNILDGSDSQECYGIYLEGSDGNVFGGNRITKCQSSGINLWRSDGNVWIGNKVTHNEKYGIRVGNCRGNKFYSNQIEYNHDSGIWITASEDTIVSHNRIRHNGPGTAVYIDASGGEIMGNEISHEQSDGIRAENGANPTIRKNNIFANEALAVNNLDPSLTLDARDNWWGDPSGPGGEGPGSGDEVSAGVDFSPWRTAPVALVTSVAEATVYAARGMTGTNTFFFRNWAAPTDTVTVTLTEAQSWLTVPLTFTVPLTDSIGGSTIVTFAIPADTPIGATNRVTATTVSQADPAVRETVSFQVVVTSMADLQVTKEVQGDASAPVGPGDTITYTLVISNSGPDAATGVVVTDTLPPEVTFVSADTTQGSCTEQEGTVLCDLGAIDAGAAVTVTFVVSVSEPSVTGSLVNVAWATAMERDPDPYNNADAAYTLVAPPPLAIGKMADRESVIAGERIIYTVTITNARPTTPITVTVVDTFGDPAALAGVAYDGDCAWTPGSAVITCTVPNVAFNAAVSLTLVVTTSATYSGILSNTAVVTLTEAVTDFIPSDNQAGPVEVAVYAPVVANFTGWPTSGVAPLTVVFTNTSSGDYTTSLWDFGDGITSTLESPTHTYTAAGVYTVTLTVSGPGGSDTEAKAEYISVKYTVYLPLVLSEAEGLVVMVGGGVAETPPPSPWYVAWQPRRRHLPAE